MTYERCVVGTDSRISWPYPTESLDEGIKARTCCKPALLLNQLLNGNVAVA
jgi:hypothetical protein